MFACLSPPLGLDYQRCLKNAVKVVGNVTQLSSTCGSAYLGASELPLILALLSLQLLNFLLQLLDFLKQVLQERQKVAFYSPCEATDFLFQSPVMHQRGF